MVNVGIVWSSKTSFTCVSWWYYHHCTTIMYNHLVYKHIWGRSKTFLFSGFWPPCPLLPHSLNPPEGRPKPWYLLSKKILKKAKNFRLYTLDLFRVCGVVAATNKKRISIPFLLKGWRSKIFIPAFGHGLQKWSSIESSILYTRTFIVNSMLLINPLGIDSIIFV